jgi:hypothetical protein
VVAKRALSDSHNSVVTRRSWYCPGCHRLFATGHAIKTSVGRFHNRICSQPLIRVRVSKA